MRFPRTTRIYHGQLDASPFVGVLFLLAIFLLLNSSLVFTPGVPIRLPESAELPGVIGPTVTVAVDSGGKLYYRNQIITESDLKLKLCQAVSEVKKSVTLVLQADKSVPNETLVRLANLARECGIREALLAVRSGPPAIESRGR
jgi:biopolymer transport protein ExbD